MGQTIMLGSPLLVIAVIVGLVLRFEPEARIRGRRATHVQFMGTASRDEWLDEVVWNTMLGWAGIDQHDAENPVGQEFLERYDERLGTPDGPPPPRPTGCHHGAAHPVPVSIDAWRLR